MVMVLLLVLLLVVLLLLLVKCRDKVVFPPPFFCSPGVGTGPV